MKDYLPIIIFLGLFLLTEFLPTGTVTVKPIFSYGKFLEWYKNTIGDYNSDAQSRMKLIGSIIMQLKF